MQARVALLALVVLLTGCTTSLTNMAPAETLDPGEAQATGGYQFDVHSQTFTGIYRAGEAVLSDIERADSEDPVSEETLRALFDTLVLWKIFPFGGGPEFMGRTGVYDGIDAGLRYNGNVVKGDVRFRLWESTSGDRTKALNAQFGYGHHSSPFGDAIEWLGVESWSRSDFDFALNYGYEIGDWAKMYIAPRYVFSNISMDLEVNERLRERIPEEYRDWEANDLFSAGSMHYIGANMGIMLGYRYLFATVDLSTFRILFSPEILGSQRDYDGWVLSPTLGLTFLWE